MSIVHLLEREKDEELPSLAVALGGSSVSGSTDRRHLGIFFRAHESAEKLIHLGWHGRFEVTSISDNYCWVRISGVDPIVLDNIADWLPQLWRENGADIAYSIKPFDRNPFELEGKVALVEPGDGFTCATFVLWVFHRFNIEFISLEGWEDRAEDLVWRKWIMQMLRRTEGITKVHIEAQVPYVEHAARFRPEEVAGAAGNFQGNSLKFPDAIAAGVQVLAEMTELKKI